MQETVINTKGANGMNGLDLSAHLELFTSITEHFPAVFVNSTQLNSSLIRTVA